MPDGRGLEGAVGEARNSLLVRQLFEEVLSQGAVDAIAELIAADSVDHGPAMVGVANGAEGFKRVVTSLRAAMPDLRFDVEDLIATGDRVVVRWTAHGTLTGTLLGVRPTGKRALITGVVIYRLVGGRIQESWGNYDSLGMLLQFGILPEAAVPRGTL